MRSAGKVVETTARAEGGKKVLEGVGEGKERGGLSCAVAAAEVEAIGEGEEDKKWSGGDSLRFVVDQRRPHKISLRRSGGKFCMNNPENVYIRRFCRNNLPIISCLAMCEIIWG